MNILSKAIMAVVLSTASSFSHASKFEASGSCEVFFSPRGGAVDALVHYISTTKHSIRAMAYSFTSKPISDALMDAQKRGVDVAVIVDGGQPSAKGNKVHAVIEAGIKTRMDQAHAIQHNKTMVFDDFYVATGSFNFSANAESSNAENLLICGNKTQAAIYLDDWEKHWAHAVEMKDFVPKKSYYSR